MPRFQPKRDEQIFAQMLARVVARTDMSDVTTSSTIRHVLAAASRADGEIYYQMILLLQLFSIDTATGDDLDARAKDVQPSVLQRFQATKAIGSVVFSRNGTTGTITIPVGTKVKTPDGVVFTTTAVGTISPSSVQQISGHGTGRDSAPVAVLADLTGSTGRVSANVVTKFLAKPAGVDEVTNPSAFTTGGIDKETDDAFRARIKKFIAGLARSTPLAIEAGVLGITIPSGRSVLFSQVVEDIVTRGLVTLYIDDGTGTAEEHADVTGENVTIGLLGPPLDSAVGGEKTLFLASKPVKQSSPFSLTSSVRGALAIGTDYQLNPASGQIQFSPALVASEVITADYSYYTGLIAAAQKVVDGVKADRINFPGLRAAGILVVTQVPQILLQNVTVSHLSILKGFDSETVVANVEAAILTYINGLAIAGPVQVNKLIAAIEAVPGVDDFALEEPTTNVPIVDGQMARTTSSNITVS